MSNNTVKEIITRLYSEYDTYLLSDICKHLYLQNQANQIHFEKIHSTNTEIEKTKIIAAKTIIDTQKNYLIAATPGWSWYLYLKHRDTEYLCVSSLPFKCEPANIRVLQKENSAIKDSKNISVFRIKSDYTLSFKSKDSAFPYTILIAFSDIVNFKNCDLIIFSEYYTNLRFIANPVSTIIIRNQDTLQAYTTKYTIQPTKI